MSCSTTDCKSTCDNAIQAHYLLEPGNMYGITVDCKQRIWTGSWSKLPTSDAKRYDPFAPEEQRLRLVPNTPDTNGIAADAKGFVWGAGTLTGDQLPCLRYPGGTCDCGLDID